MASPIFKLPTTTLKHTVAENTNLNAFLLFILKFTHILSINQPAIRPGSASATALEFLHHKGNCVEFTKLLFQKNVYPLRHGASFYPLLVIFHLKSFTER